MLPHLKGRPCSLVRGPRASAASCSSRSTSSKLQHPRRASELDPALWPGPRAAARGADRARRCVGAAQMNVIEFHTWNATAQEHRQARPHGLRPRPRRRRRAGRACRRRRRWCARCSTELGLQAWLKTSGGKGLHVVVPLAPRYDWDTVKGFSQAVVQHLAQHDSRRASSAKSGAAQPRRQDLRRLPAQRPRRDHRGGVLGARAARPGRVDAGGVGRAERAQERRAVDDRARRASTCRSRRPTPGPTTGARGRRWPRP